MSGLKLKEGEIGIRNVHPHQQRKPYHYSKIEFDRAIYVLVVICSCFKWSF